MLNRRFFIKFVIFPISLVTMGHAPWGQWQVYRMRHMLLLSVIEDEKSYPFSKQIIESLEKCRIISRTGIGFENVDLKAATQMGIYVSNVPDYCIPEVSDHAIGLVLSLERRITSFDRDIREGGWKVARDKWTDMRRVEGQTIGFVAFGQIPKEVCRKAIALGFDAMAYDPYIDPEEIIKSGARCVENLDTLLKNSDVVSLHVPLTDETRGMIGKRELELIGENGFVINTSTIAD